VDLSATPFFIQGSGNEVGKPFPWVLSDFSLLEAIEAGLVKVPQLPTDEAATGRHRPISMCGAGSRSEPRKMGHIGPVTVAEVMRYATAPIVTLAASWRETAASWRKHFESRESTARRSAGLHHRMPRHHDRQSNVRLAREWRRAVRRRCA